MAEADRGILVEVPATPPSAAAIFGDRLADVEAFAGLLARYGVERGLIGPREVDRLWDRHILNSAVVATDMSEGATVVDIGSGAGLPGIPLAFARPDLRITLVEPMARRIEWLSEVVSTLGLPISVIRGRAEERTVQDQVGGADVVTARAVAPLAKLAGWALPLLRPGGHLIALKGASAADEVTRDRDAVRRIGGGEPLIRQYGGDVLDVPTTVVVVERTSSGTRRDRGRKTRKDR
jgi:16S rRNA (guanine527-N7)-methyltransferase